MYSAKIILLQKITKKENPMTTSSEFRRRARETLGGNIFSSQWIYALLVSLIYALVTGGLSATGYLSIFVFVFMGPICIGYEKYYLERSRRNIAHDNISVGLDGFKGDIGQNIVTGLLVQVYTFLWTLLFVVPGIVKAYSYSMTYYIKCDHPEYTAKQAIDESRRMMYGNKFRLFKLHLSFIGWFIVGAICLGIGTLWVSAYAQAAIAEFYEEVRVQQCNNANNDNIVNP